MLDHKLGGFCLASATLAAADVSASRRAWSPNNHTLVLVCLEEIVEAAIRDGKDVRRGLPTLLVLVELVRLEMRGFSKGNTSSP